VDPLAAIKHLIHSNISTMTNRRDEVLFKSLIIRTFLYPQNYPYDSPVFYREIGPRGIASPALMKIGYYKSPNPDESLTTDFFLLSGIFSIGKSTLTRSRVSYLADPRFPICDGALCTLQPPPANSSHM
jgi:hypothetical protein